MVKNLTANAGDIRDAVLIPVSGRSPSEGNGYPLQYSYLKNSKDREAWGATIHWVENNWKKWKKLGKKGSVGKSVKINVSKDTILGVVRH